MNEHEQTALGCLDVAREIKRELDALHSDHHARDRHQKIGRLKQELGLVLVQAKVYSNLAIAEAFQEWTSLGREGLDAAGPQLHVVPPATPLDVPTAEHVKPQVVGDLLSLVSDEIPGRVVPDHDLIAAWPPETRQAVADWAAAVHLVASDNDGVEIPDIPGVLL